VIAKVVVLEHPFASVTVYEYEPAVSVYDPVPLYGNVPPVADTSTVEVPPKQRIALDELDASNKAGSLMLTVVVVEHPFASVTV